MYLSSIQTLLIFLIFLMPCLLLGQEKRVIETDVCSLTAHPKQFNHKRVRVRARVETVVIEGGWWLKDPACESHGVELSVPDSIRNHEDQHPDYSALDDAVVRQGNIGTIGKRITASFTGEFNSHSKHPKWVLTLEKIENLDVKIKKPQSKMQ